MIQEGNMNQLPDTDQNGENPGNSSCNTNDDQCQPMSADASQCQQMSANVSRC